MEELNNNSTERSESSIMEKLKNYIKNYWSTSIDPSSSASSYTSTSVTPNNSNNAQKYLNSQLNSNKLNTINTINSC